jgi:hypothetical protein
MAKVGNKDKDKKEKKKGRVDFDIAAARILDAETDKLVKAANKDGLLTVIPKTIPGKNEGDKPRYEGYDSRKHKPLKKGDFAEVATYLEFQAMQNREKAAKLIVLAEEKEKKADRIRKFGDEATRKKAAKVARMRDQLAVLEKQLEEEGISVEDI